jgi:hypothetical protein
MAARQRPKKVVSLDQFINMSARHYEGCGYHVHTTPRGCILSCPDGSVEMIAVPGACTCKPQRCGGWLMIERYEIH